MQADCDWGHEFLPEKYMKGPYESILSKQIQIQLTTYLNFLFNLKRSSMYQSE